MSVGNGWHLEKRVSLGHIATTMIVAAAVVTAYFNLDKRVDLNARDIQQMRVEAHRSEERTAEALQEIRDSLRRIERRLDGVIDRPVRRSDSP